MNKAGEEIEIFNIRGIINFYLKHWYWIGIAVFLALLFAFMVNRYSPSIYLVSTSLMVNEESSGATNSSAQLLRDLGFMTSNKSFTNEMFVLKSTPLIKDAVAKLDFQISYFENSVFGSKELYKTSPFIVILDKNYPQPVGAEFNIRFLDNNTFKLTLDAEDVPIYSFVSKDVVQRVDHLDIDDEFEFNTFMVSDYLKFKILVNSKVDFEELEGKKFSFRINTIDGLVKGYKAQLEIIPPNLESTVAEIRMETNTPGKSIEFLNSLTEAYVNMDISKKKHASIRTIEYINNQLNVVGDSLSNAEENLQSFRSQNDVTDLTVQSSQLLDELRTLESQKAKLDMNSKYYEYVRDYFATKSEFDELIAPSAMGIDDALLNNLIEELIRLNAEKASFLENNQSRSPYLKKINIRFENLSKMVAENIAYYRRNNNIALADVNRRIGDINFQIDKLPSTERALLGMKRKFNVNDAIFTYLLQKRAEAEIAKASYQADTDLLEPAQIVGFGPISPKKRFNYAIAILLGIFFPTLIIKLKDILRPSFAEESQLESHLHFPVLGKVHYMDKGVHNVVERYPDSYVAENFRAARVGLNYFLKNKQHKLIVIGSTISGEGKSFVALNLALSIAKTEFKVVLIYFDLRKRHADVKYKKLNKLGLSDYLSDQADIQEIITPTDQPGMDVILPGPLAPNAAELLQSGKTLDLIDTLKKKYDYVIIDTPPIGLVSDGYVLMEHADINIIVTRVKITPKTEFANVQDDLMEKQLKTCYIINGLDQNKNRKYRKAYYN